MRSAQLIAIDLPDAADVAASLLPGREVAVHSADDFDEAADLAGVVGADLVFLSAAAAGEDPFARIEALGKAFGERPPPFAAIVPGALRSTRIYVKPQVDTEWVALSPGGEKLAPYLAALLEKGDAVVHAELPPVAALKSRLIDIGFNSIVKGEGGDVSVQTETHVLGGRAVIRSTAFAAGRITLSRRFPIGFVANPIEEARRLAEEIHRETCDRVVVRAADRS
ncbi:MAG: hypothetical protein M0R80_24630 [Proteobacteria bacterium]|jgi:hypothetical protein|nr:hypothetical protein [Pseudomonadota bacterium]